MRDRIDPTYLTEITREPMLSAEEEWELAGAAALGDEAARSRMVGDERAHAGRRLPLFEADHAGPRLVLADPGVEPDRGALRVGRGGRGFEPAEAGRRGVDRLPSRDSSRESWPSLIPGVASIAWVGYNLVAPGEWVIGRAR